MSKFNVGDKVRRVSGNNSSTPVGFEGKIKRIEYERDPITEKLWFSDLEWGYNDHTAKWELVTEGPVRTVTRLEPVEGKHGIVQLDVHNGQIVVTISPEDGHQPSGDALRSAAMILSQIAEYRDEVTK